MNPVAVRAVGYRSFDEVSLELPAGCLALTGANGAGKSSLVNIILLALFAERGELANEIGEHDDRLEIECRFEHQGAEYRARRSCTRKGKSTFDLERFEGDAYYPLTRETIAATDDLLQEILGLHRETFEASAFLGQGRGALFTEAAPRDRKRILAEVLNLSLWDRLLERAKADRNSIEAECAAIRTRIGSAAEEILRRPILEGSKAELDEKAEELAARIAGLEEARKDAADKLGSAREAAAELKGAREVLATRETELQRVEKRVAEIRSQEAGADALRSEGQQAAALGLKVPGLERELAEAREQLEQLRERGRLIDESKRGHNEILAIDAETKKLEAKLNELRTAESPRCDRCQQELPDEARIRALESLVADATALADKASKLRADQATLLEQVDAIAVADLLLNPDAIEKELAIARDATARVREIEARLQRLDELKAEREQLEEGLPGLLTALEEQRTKLARLADVPDVRTLDEQLAAVELQLNAARDELTETGRALARVEHDLERISELERRVAGEKERLDELQAELDVVLLAERAYGRDGIPALILENAAIPQIELEASRILSELGTSFTVELRTQRELKGGGLAEALDIVVCSEGAERPLETFSGGERSRIVVALRIALARLLAHRRGAEVRMLVLDEVEYLDEPGMAALVSVLQGLVADFERVIVVSHVPALRDAFDNVIEVVKGEDGRSRVEGAVEAEAVAA